MSRRETMEEQVIHRMCSSGIPDQCCTHVISTCFDFLKEPQYMIDGLKKSESDTEILRANRKNHCELSSKILDGGDDAVVLRETRGKNRNLASEQISQAFQFLKGIPTDSLHEQAALLLSSSPSDSTWTQNSKLEQISEDDCQLKDRDGLPDIPPAPLSKDVFLAGDDLQVDNKDAMDLKESEDEKSLVCSNGKNERTNALSSEENEALSSAKGQKLERGDENCSGVGIFPAVNAEQSSFTASGYVRQRQVKKNVKGSPAVDLSEEESSDDDDSSIYAESTRNSCWIYIAEDASYSAQHPQSEDEKDGKKSSADEDNVFSNRNGHVQNRHKRSDSNATTASENSFRRQFWHRRKKIVFRNKTQNEYQRFSAKFLDFEEVVHITKDVTEEYGIHILDSHPAVVTAIDAGSPAERGGMKKGQIIVSVNNVNVMESSHEEIIQLIQKDPESLMLAVGCSNLSYSRDLETPVVIGYMYKLGSTLSLIKNASWRKRWFVLRQDNCLYYYKSEKEDTPLGAVPLSNYCISRYLDTNKDFCFKAEKYGSRTYYFMNDSREEMNRWVEALQLAAHSPRRKESWIDVTSHNVGIQALEIKKPDCSGYLYKMGNSRKVWRRRYCILKDGCLYYFKNMDSSCAQGVAHFHGYEVDEKGLSDKKFGFILQPPEENLRTFYFNAENETDRKRWIVALKKSIGLWVCVSTA